MRFADQIIPVAFGQICPGLLGDRGTAEGAQLRHGRTADNLRGRDISRCDPRRLTGENRKRPQTWTQGLDWAATG